MGKIIKFEQFIKEGYDDYETLDDIYFIRRVPFFKDFENMSGSQVLFELNKSYNNSATLHFGKGNGFVTFPFLSILTRFNYYTIRQRDFESEANLIVFKPMFKTEHRFLYSTIIHMTMPEIDGESDLVNQIVASMFKEVMKNELSINESFVIRDGEPMSDQLDSIINTINKHCFKIEETMDKLGVSYF